MTITVAHIMGKMLGGGVESVVMNYYRHIDRDRVQFDFLVDEDSLLVPDDEIAALGGRVVYVPPYQQLARYQRELTRLFTDRQYRIVHSHINALSVFPLCAAKKAGVPVRIAHSHSTAGKGEQAKNAAKNALRRLSNVYPTHRLACSRYAGEWLFGKDADFCVMYNAIELDRFSFDSQKRAQVRTDLGICDEIFVIGHVGRFMPQKNHKFLIRAFAHLCEIRNDCILLCVGDGELKSAVKGFADDCGLSGKVRFLGQWDDVARLYQAFDAFVLPSRYEGLGIVAVEAQRAGLPCVLSDAITREVDLTGQIEFLPIDDPLKWAEFLCALAPGVRFNVRSSDFVDYDIDSAARKMLRLYEQMATEAAV